MESIKAGGIGIREKAVDYRDLKIYQKPREVVQLLNKIMNSWPKTMQSQEIKRQLFRSATSIGANIAEGHGRHVGREYIHYLTIAQGSANEVDHWLNTALDCGIGSAKELNNLISLNNETRKMLNASINTLKKRRDNKIMHETPAPYAPIPYSPENSEEKL